MAPYIVVGSLAVFVLFVLYVIDAYFGFSDSFAHMMERREKDRAARHAWMRRQEARNRRWWWG